MSTRAGPAEPQFDEDEVKVVQGSCGANPSTVGLDEQTTLQATIRNENPVPTTQRASFFLITAPCGPTPILQESAAFTLDSGGAARVAIPARASNPLADSGGCIGLGDWPLFVQPVDVSRAQTAAVDATDQTIKVAAQEAKLMSADPRARPESASCGSLTIREPFDPDLVDVPACGNFSPSDPLPGQTVEVTYTVENQNPVGAEYTIAVAVGGQRIHTTGRQSIGPDAQDRGKTTSFQVPDRPGESPLVEVSAIDVTEISGFTLNRRMPARMAQAAGVGAPSDRDTLVTALVGVGAGGLGLLARRLSR